MVLEKGSRTLFSRLCLSFYLGIQILVSIEMESCLFFNGYNRYIVQHKIFYHFSQFFFFLEFLNEGSTIWSSSATVDRSGPLMDPDFRGLFFRRRTALSKLATTQGLPNGPGKAGIVQVHELSVDMVSVRLDGFGFGETGRSQGPGTVSVEVYSSFSFLGFGERILLASSFSVFSRLSERALMGYFLL